MASKTPFWEICKSTKAAKAGSAGYPARKESTDWWARLKGRNGKTIATTETYTTKGSVTKALQVANPKDTYPVKDEVVEIESDETPEGVPA